MKIKIRLALGQEDYNSIKVLAEIIWKEHYTPIIGSEQVKYMLQKFQSIRSIEDQIEQGFQYYLVYLDNKIVSYFSILNRETSIFLSKIYVLAKCRGKGVGREVLDFIESLAKELSINEINLTVNKDNIGAIQAYKKLGFKNIESIVLEIGEGFVMDDYKMVKRFKSND